MNIVKQRIQESIDTKKRIVENETLLNEIMLIAQTIIDKIKAGGSVYFAEMEVVQLMLNILPPNYQDGSISTGSRSHPMLYIAIHHSLLL